MQLVAQSSPTRRILQAAVKITVMKMSDMVLAKRVQT
jgi:hypothetical protein